MSKKVYVGMSGGVDSSVTAALKVYVGMSGGVDSSVTAALLKQRGFDVTGVYMKNWTQDLPGVICPWADDLADAKRVAVQLGVDFKVFDFQKEYKQRVVDYMISEYQAGRTPNPDIMCNQEIKFKLFLQAALDDGADLIATGHYARVDNEASRASSSRLLPSVLAEAAADGVPSSRPLATKTQSDSTIKGSLLTAKDTAKDQTYFLYRVNEGALEKTLFPIGEFTKPEIRKLAHDFGLATADKKDSQGICFVGEVGIKDFLSQYIQGELGDIIDKRSGEVIGQHEGAIFYTIGQRQGLGVGGGLPYYVVSKDMAKNIVYVTTDLNDEALWRSEVIINQLHWINEAPTEGKKYMARMRYRASLVGCSLKLGNGSATIKLDEPERAIAVGQSVVLYDGERVVGGGIIC